jgi:hypothetical protein
MVLFVTMVTKLGYIVQLFQVKNDEKSPKPFLDDFCPTSGEREKLESGTKQEKIAICQVHLMLWYSMLAAVSNSEFRSKSNESNSSHGANAAAVKLEQKSKRIKSQAKSQVKSQVTPEV